MKANQLKARLHAVIAEHADGDETLSEDKIRTLPPFLQGSTELAQRWAAPDEITPKGLARVAERDLGRYLDRFTDFDGTFRRPQLVRSPDTPERQMSLTLFELASQEVSFKQLQAPKVLRVYHVSEEPLAHVDARYKSATGPEGLWTTTDPTSSAGRTGTAHAFRIDMAGLFEGVDYIKVASSPWYLFCSARALQALQRDPERDTPV